MALHVPGQTCRIDDAGRALRAMCRNKRGVCGELRMPLTYRPPAMPAPRPSLESCWDAWGQARHAHAQNRRNQNSCVETSVTKT